MSGNQLSNLSELGQLAYLTSLDVKNNELTSLAGLEQFTNLTCLDLSWNDKLTSLAELKQLSYLTFLNLHGNQLTGIETLNQLSYLIFLGLSGNQLTNLSGLERLVHLNHLELSVNKLSSLEELNQLTNLAFLRLSECQSLTHIPETLLLLSKLEGLTLENLGTGKNSIVQPPIEQLELEDYYFSKRVNLFKVRNYLRQLVEEGKDYLYEAKLLIVGEGEAGKTSLARKIQNPAYPLTKNGISSTEGIDVIRWQFPYNAEHPYRVNIWDFGGQEIYHATHQFFLTKRALYVLVADNRKEDTDFYYWLSIVELLSDNSPLLIVKNEKDDRSRDINETALRGQFNNLKEVYATNLKTNSKEFHKLCDDLQHQLKYLPHIGTPLPKRWIDVRKALETDTRNYITLLEFLNLCEQHGFKNQGNKLHLSETLHDLGSILHFQQDPLLLKTIFLKPHWATQAVYHVLDNPIVKKNFGKFTTVDLAKIWHEPEYDFMHGELLQLMLKFKLCYPLNYCQHTYVAPQLLTVVQPNYSWPASGNLVVFYKNYEFMPKGMLTQLIVVLHQHIADQQHCVWRNGVVLEKDRTQAEVIEDYGKREIQIKVVGQNKRDLMTIIIHELQKIHDSYHKRLKYEILFPCDCMEPEYFNYEKLKEFSADQDSIQCQKRGCRKMLQARDLIEGVLNIKKSVEQEPENDFLKRLLLEEAKRPITATAESKIVNKEEHRTVTVGGNVTGSTLNLGEISGNVTNTIQQLPDSPTTSGQPNLKTLLTQLQDLIEKANDTELKPQDKADGLEQVQQLAEAIQQPQEKSSIIRNTLRSFKGFAEELKNAKELATKIKEIVTAIATFFP